jgi:hypothetical protein
MELLTYPKMLLREKVFALLRFLPMDVIKVVFEGANVQTVSVSQYI